MEPSFSIDLTSIGGIAAATWACVELLKRLTARTPAINCVPIWLYGLVISGVLTYVAHDVLHVLDGNLRELLVQALLASLVSSGALEQLRTASKPIGASSAARAKRNGGYTLPIIMLAAALGAGCAGRLTPTLKASERGVRAAVVAVSTNVKPLVCGEEARQALGSQRCLQLLDALDPATDLALAYNRALSNGQVPNAADMVKAVDNLVAAIKAVVPDGTVKTAALLDLLFARARAEGGQ